MDRRIPGVFAALFLFAALQSPARAALAPPQAQPAASLQALESAIRDAAQKAQNGDFASVLAGLEPVVADPGFSAVDPQLRHAAYRLLGVARLETGHADAALPMLQQACTGPWADGMDWYFRILADVTAQDRTDAVTALTALAKGWPDTLSQLSDRFILRLVYQAAQLAPVQDGSLAEALVAAHWQPADPFLPTDALTMALVRLRLGRGDIDGAVAAAKKLTRIDALITIRDDNRYAAVLQRMPDFFDPARYLNRISKAEQAKAAAAPALLAGVNVRASLLLKRGQAQAALDLLEPALAQVRQNGLGKPFSDLETELNWTLNLQSQAMLVLGRRDDAVQVLQQAARTPEDGQVNVSQTINLGDLYVTLGQPKAALETVAYLDGGPMSAYGKMALADVRVCAYAQTGDRASMKTSLAFMAEHSAEGMQPYLHALLCAGDADAAARLIIAELASPETRAGMLIDLQNYTVTRPLPAFDRQQQQALHDLTQRADVKAAIARVGRIEDYDLLPADY